MGSMGDPFGNYCLYFPILGADYKKCDMVTLSDKKVITDLFSKRDIFVRKCKPQPIKTGIGVKVRR